MKLVTIFTLVAFVALAGQIAPTLSTSCTVCAQGESVIFSGSGYRHGDQIYLDIAGPTQHTIAVEILQKGSFSLYFADLLTYAPGVYTVTAIRIKGSGQQIPMTVTSFTVQ